MTSYISCFVALKLRSSALKELNSPEFFRRLTLCTTWSDVRPCPQVGFSGLRQRYSPSRAVKKGSQKLASAEKK